MQNTKYKPLDYNLEWKHKFKLILNNYMKTLKLCWDLEDQFLDINLPRGSYEFIPPMGIAVKDE